VPSLYYTYDKFVKSMLNTMRAFSSNLWALFSEEKKVTTICLYLSCLLEHLHNFYFLRGWSICIIILQFGVIRSLLMKRAEYVSILETIISEYDIL